MEEVVNRNKKVEGFQKKDVPFIQNPRHFSESKATNFC